MPSVEADGAVGLPPGPGLGLTVDEAFARDNNDGIWIPEAFRKDGTIADW